jgi:hypothetical protein
MHFLIAITLQIHLEISHPGHDHYSDLVLKRIVLTIIDKYPVVATLDSDCIVRRIIGVIQPAY